MNQSELKEIIKEFKIKKNAFIIAHNYMLPEVQDVADYVGDSLGMAQVARKADSSFIIVCGVYFMAETAAIINPEKKVFIPDKDAGCPLSNFANEKMILEWRKKYPDYTFVAYVNTGAKVKAYSDICCTSANAVKVVKSIKNDKIVFLPDRNLGDYVSKQVPEKKFVLWPGYCIVHENVELNSVIAVKEMNPDAKILVHPECPENIRNIADVICSTSQMIDFVEKNKDCNKFIVVTEWGINYALKKKFPEKTFIEPRNRMECVNMKKITLDKILNVLMDEMNQVYVEKEIIEKARNAIDKMLNII